MVSSVDMRYGYEQLPLAESTTKHFSFQIIGEKNHAGIYLVVTGRYGLSKMPTDLY